MTVPSNADLCDRFGDRAQVCRAPLRAYGGALRAAGRIATLRCLDDAGLLRRQLEQPGHARILVVDGGASQRVAILGDRMARLALENGWAGIIINGAVRDVEPLASMRIVVMALGHVPVRGGNSGHGESNVEMAFGEAVFRPGQFVCVDPDGVIVLPDAPSDPMDGVQAQG